MNMISQQRNQCRHTLHTIIAAMAELVELRDQGAEGSIHGLRDRGAHFWVQLRLWMRRALVGAHRLVRVDRGERAPEATVVFAFPKLPVRVRVLGRMRLNLHFLNR